MSEELFRSSWTVAHRASLSMGLSRLEYWSGLPFPSPEELSEPEIKPASPALAGGFFTNSHQGSPTYSFSHGTRKQCQILRNTLLFKFRYYFVLVQPNYIYRSDNSRYVVLLKKELISRYPQRPCPLITVTSYIVFTITIRHTAQPMKLHP